MKTKKILLIIFKKKKMKKEQQHMKALLILTSLSEFENRIKTSKEQSEKVLPELRKEFKEDIKRWEKAISNLKRNYNVLKFEKL